MTSIIVNLKLKLIIVIIHISKADKGKAIIGCRGAGAQACDCQRDDG